MVTAYDPSQNEPMLTHKNFEAKAHEGKPYNVKAR